MPTAAAHVDDAYTAVAAARVGDTYNPAVAAADGYAAAAREAEASSAEVG